MIAVGRLKRLFARFALFAFGLLISLALLEGLCSALAWVKYHTLSVERLNDLDLGITAAVVPHDETFADMVRPHPYLGITPNVDMESRPKQNWRLNDVMNFPATRDEQKFTLLLTGGSAAQLLATSRDDSAPRTYLEAALDRLDFGGKKVVVLNAGIGATSQPRQAIALLLYGDVIDAVINLDGYNESAVMGRIGPGYSKLGYPNPWFEELNPMVTGSAERLAINWEIGRLREISRAWDSRALFFATKLRRDHLQTTLPVDDDRASYFTALWSNPGGWNDTERIERNLERYKHNLRMMHAMADKLHLREAYFIQPCPAIGKTLTEEETRIVGNLAYASAYRHMTDGLMSLNDEGVPITPLLDLYENIHDTVYVDAIHCNLKGYQIMAERMVAELSHRWNIPTK